MALRFDRPIEVSNLIRILNSKDDRKRVGIFAEEPYRGRLAVYNDDDTVSLDTSFDFTGELAAQNFQLISVTLKIPGEEALVVKIIYKGLVRITENNRLDDVLITMGAIDDAGNVIE